MKPRRLQRETIVAMKLAVLLGAGILNSPLLLLTSGGPRSIAVGRARAQRPVLAI
jgi:hypothetical protein